GLRDLGPELDRPVERKEISVEDAPPRTLCGREQNRSPRQLLAQPFLCVRRGDEIDPQPVRTQRLGGRRPDRRDAVRGDAATRELVCAVAARDDEPVVRASVDRLLAQRLDTDQLAEDGVVPERLDSGDELLTRDEYSHPPAPPRAPPGRRPCAARSTTRPPPRRARSTPSRRGAPPRE